MKRKRKINKNKKLKKLREPRTVKDRFLSENQGLIPLVLIGGILIAIVLFLAFTKQL
jgi:hypothetical protein